MKKLILASLAAGSLLYGETFMKPVDSYVTVGYDVDNCYFCNGRHHTALDYSKNGSHTVVASNDGVVERVEQMSAHDHGMGNNVIIKHFLKNGGVIYSSYSHLNSILPHIKKGYTVKRGEKIGVMGGSGYGKRDYWGVHLHFEMKTKPVTGSPLHGNYWGYTPYSATYHGYRNPDNYIGKVDVKKSSAQSAGIFSGAGSLVSPHENCYGCNKDIVRLHRENGIGSTGVFQWRYDATDCSHLDIYSNKNLGDVIIKSKSWGNDYIHKAFKVSLKAYERVSLKPDDTWTTFAVTTTNSLKSASADVVAECKSDGDTFHRANRVSVATDPVDVTHGYDWTGTGSLITFSSEPAGSFGRDKDIANTRTVDSKNAFTTFQWYADGGCSSVRVSRNNSSVPAHINSLSIKKWYEPNSKWKTTNCHILPCDVSVNSDGYYIMKIGSQKGALNGEHLLVECKR